MLNIISFGAKLTSSSSFQHVIDLNKKLNLLGTNIGVFSSSGKQRIKPTRIVCLKQRAWLSCIRFHVVKVPDYKIFEPKEEYILSN